MFFGMATPLEPTGTIYDIQGFSVQDGPGIRTTVFLKGCPLRCPWCHSPESQRFDIQLSWQERKCIGIDECGRCLDCCPNEAISAAREPASAGGDRGFGPRRPRRLAEVRRLRGLRRECPAGALSMWGKRYTVREVVDRVVRDRPFFERSGGASPSRAANRYPRPPSPRHC